MAPKTDTTPRSPRNGSTTVGADGVEWAKSRGRVDNDAIGAPCAAATEGGLGENLGGATGQVHGF